MKTKDWNGTRGVIRACALALGLVLLPAAGCEFIDDANIDNCLVQGECGTVDPIMDPPERDPVVQTYPPQAPYCDATPLEGLECDCGGLPVDVITHQQEIVSDGEASLVLHAAGSAALGFFDACRDIYAWEEDGPGCVLVVVNPDNGCGGLTLQDAPDAVCPYVEDYDLATVCTDRERVQFPMRDQPHRPI